MAEDYTYTTVTDWRKRAEIAETMARELADSVKAYGDKVSRLVDENAELRAKLDAVPLAAIRYMLDPFANGGTSWAESEAHMNTLTAWVKAQEVQTVAQLAARLQELERELAQAHSNTVALAARNAELAAAYQPVEKAMRRIWNAYSFGTAGTSIGEDFNHIKAWLDGVRVDA